ncbi:HAD-IC family P-type ATPase, partial [Candidatus Woesearchaeota archaeon]|nr:HAD-IC family P-type ATPase [Candidatus Woesearchaeota archaeon]
MDYYTRTKEEVIRELNTSSAGLTQEEAEKRLQKYGQNIIKKTHKLRPIKIFLEQFKSFLIYILIIAIIISFLIGNLIDAGVIIVIVIVNASLGFFQQYKAEKAIIGLRNLLVPISKVIRDNRYVEIPSTEIVPGDVIVFNAGDKINADCRIIESEKLQTNEAVLTGESLPINKIDKKLPAETILPERFNMLYTGTEIVRGNAKAVVVATAMETEFGKIASQVQEIKIQKTPMQKRLDVFSKQLGFIILGLVLIIMFLGILEHFDKFEMFMTALALAVGSIPEGLPAVLAISFAISTVFMSKKNVIIRKLPAVESLGSVTVICSDKTGTITEEEMNVQDIYVNGKNYIKKAKTIYLNSKKIDIKGNKELAQIIKTSILCNNARYEELESGEYSIIGDPTEKALLKLSLDLRISKKRLTELEPRLEEVEFDPERKMMSILREAERNNILYSKGAPEKILFKCTSELINGQIKSLNEARKRELLKESAKMEDDALRVLGFAYKNFSKESKAEEKGLIFLGFMGMIDPPRPEVKDAIWQAQNAGIKIKMITGDSVLTASAIAKQIGIRGEVITGKEVDEMSERDLLRRIDKISIFARTTPQQKLKITKVLQSREETVAITGDGINDVLALKKADIGIAMGKRGTDVARDTADVILTDDNFASIISGIKEG